MAKRKSPSPAKKGAAKRAVAAKTQVNPTEPAFAATPVAATAPSEAPNPIFSEPGFMQDPTQYRTTHASDSAAYKELDQLTKLKQFNPMPFRVLEGVTEPVLKLAAAYGSS